jgi:hypothetical protein
MPVISRWAPAADDASVILTMNASVGDRTAFCSGRASGKFVDEVPPVMTTLPAASTAMPHGWSSPLPPRYDA